MSSTPHGLHRHSSQSGFLSRQSLDSYSTSAQNSAPCVNVIDENMDGEQNGTHSNSTLNEKKNSFFDVFKLNCDDEASMASKLTTITQAPRICHELREDGILRILIELLHQHTTEEDDEYVEFDLKARTECYRQKIQLRRNSSKALRNIIRDTAKNKKELQILNLLEDLRSFVEVLFVKYSDLSPECCDHPCAQLTEVYQIICDQESKNIMEMLGGVYVIMDVIQTDYRFHKNSCANQHCIQLRQSSLNILTQMTCNNQNIKSLLGKTRSFMFMLVDLLKVSQENLSFIQSISSVFHNLSWKADYSSRQIMRDCEAVKCLTETAMRTKDQSVLNTLFAPLLNLTAHSPPNKHDFCRVEGALNFLISSLVIHNDSSGDSSNNQRNSANRPTRAQLAIVENAGGILRNISSYLSEQEPLLVQLRAKDICSILMEQLKSTSLVIVSNACITLSYLTAKSKQEQTKLIQLGAVNLLQKLTASKHEAIQVGAKKTIKQLYPNLYPSQNDSNKTPNAMKTSHSIPTALHMRKMKGFMNDITNCLNEDYDKMLKDNNNNNSLLMNSKSQTLNRATSAKMQMNSMVNSFNNGVSPGMNGNKFNKVQRSSSHDSIGSTHSEPVGKIFSNASNFVAESKSSAQAALAYMKVANNIDQRMVNSYSGQTLDSIYATLPANSRIREQGPGTPSDSMMNDVSDYDMSCADISGIPRSMNNSISVMSSQNSFQENEPQDPEPTDYSQRFKEQPDDDFNRSINKGDVNSGCEDTVKVYQTENTPLTFSLATSLTDLREIGNELNDKLPGNGFQDPNNICMKQTENFPQSMNYFKKAPNPPPKPNKFVPSSSAFCLKNLGSINEEETLNGTIDQNLMLNQNTTANYKQSSREEMDYQYSHLVKDSQVTYATEDTPAIFSNATSLSSLSVNDEPNGSLNEIVENVSTQVQTQQPPNNSLTINDDVDNDEGNKPTVMIESEEGDDEVFHESRNPEPRQSTTPVVTKRTSIQNSAEMPSTVSYENVKNIERNVQSHNPNPVPVQLPPTGGRKPLPPIPSEDFDAHDEEDDYGALLNQCMSHALPKSSSTVEKKAPLEANKESVDTSLQIQDEEDNYDILLNQCMSHALPKANSVAGDKPSNLGPKAHSNDKSFKQLSSRSRSPNNGLEDDDEELFGSRGRPFTLQKQNGNRKAVTPRMLTPSASVGKSPRVFKRNPNLTPNSYQISQIQSGSLEQCKLFNVEDTPVHFSTIHSSLSSLIDSDDEAHDPNAFDAAMKFAQSRAAPRDPNRSTPNTESGSNNIQPWSTAVNMPQKRVPKGFAVNSSDQSEMSQQPSSASSRSVSRQQRRQIRTNNAENGPADDEDEDEKTYTICTQSSRQNSAKTSNSVSRIGSTMDVLSGANLNTSFGVSDMKSSIAMVQSGNFHMTESMLDFDQMQPPSLVNDRKAMQSSYDSECMQRSSNIPIVNKNILTKNGQQNHQKSTNNSHASPSMDSFLDRQQPPSIMDRISIMSYSSASINEDIPEIDMDRVPIRSIASSEMVANAASSCAKEIKQMVNAMTDSTKNISLTDSVSVSRNDKTFDLEPGVFRTLSRSRGNMTSSKTPTTESDTLTYTKSSNSTQQNTLTKGSTLRDNGAHLNLDDSDTDISENLPPDDHPKHRRDGSSISSEMYSNPMSSKPGSMLSVSSKPPPPKPPVRKQSSIGSGSHRTESKCSAHSSSVVESEDPEFSDPEVFMTAAQFGYALNSRKNVSSNRDYFGQISASQQVIYPHYAHESNNGRGYPEHALQNFHSLGRNCGRNDRRIKHDRDFEDKDFMLTPDQRMQMFEHQLPNGKPQANVPNNFGTLSFHKYCDPKTIESASQLNGSMTPQDNSRARKESSKTKPSKGLLRKITSSLSSHNIGEHARTSEKVYPALPAKPNMKDVSTKKSFEKISRLSSLLSFKRSKSSHEKLDHEALNSSVIHDSKAAEPNRLIVARRSFQKKPLSTENDGRFMNISHNSVPHSPSIDNATFSTFGRTNNIPFDTQSHRQYPTQPPEMNTVHSHHTGPRSYKRPPKPNPVQPKQESPKPQPDPQPGSSSSSSHNDSQASTRKTCMVTTV